MDKVKDNPPTQDLPESLPPKVNANDLLNEFLKKNNLVLEVNAISDENSYISGRGFVLADKPLLVVSAKYK